MDDLYFPQLVSGAVVQYPFSKSRVVRTIGNVLADGRLILLPDPAATRLRWEIGYTELSTQDVQALQTHFRSCNGRLKGFTFIDPTQNMLSTSTDISGSAWERPGFIDVSTNVSDPMGGPRAFRLTNRGQIASELSQTLQVPASFQYCLSFFVRSTIESTLDLFRRGINEEGVDQVSVDSTWRRVISSGRLTEQIGQYSAGLRLQAGQQIEVFGMQLEAQIAPSSYKPTDTRGGVYSNAHWAMDELIVTADGPDQFSTTLVIETAV